MADKKKKETPYVPFVKSERFPTYEAYKQAINDKYRAGQAGTKLADWKPEPAKPGTASSFYAQGGIPSLPRSGGRSEGKTPTNPGVPLGPTGIGAGGPIPIVAGPGIRTPGPGIGSGGINASAGGRGVPERMPAGLTPGEQSAYRAKRNAGILEQRVGGQAAAAGQQAAGAAGWLGGTLNEGSDWYGERAGQLHGTYEKSIWDMINALISAMNGGG